MSRREAGEDGDVPRGREEGGMDLNAVIQERASSMSSFEVRMAREGGAGRRGRPVRVLYRHSRH